MSKKTGPDGLYQKISDALGNQISAQVVANYTSVHGWKAESEDDIDAWVESYQDKIGTIDDEQVLEAKRLSIVSKSRIDEQKALQAIEDTKKKKQEALKSRSEAKKSALQVKILEGDIVELEEMKFCFISLAEIIKNAFSNLMGELPNDLYGLEKKEMQKILEEKFHGIQQQISTKTATFADEDRAGK